jgi:hypothetical protein
MTNKKLPKEFKKKWVDALMSWKYNQTDGTLCNEHGYCCLGVACVVAGIDKNILFQTDLIPGKGYKEHYEKKFESVPKILRGGNDRHFNDSGDILHELTSMNDKYVPFEVIAGVINEYL